MAARPPAAGAGKAAAALQRAWLSRNALSIALLPLSWIFIVASGMRRAAVRIGILSVERVRVPVIVVGNLIVGGAGKTPAVLAVVALLRRHGLSPGIVSRGYGRRGDGIVEVVGTSRADQVGDEPVLLQRRAGVPVVVGVDRVGAANALLQRHPAVDIIVSDDGLQHARLGRDVQVLVFDERGIGNGWRLPAGPLREAFTTTPPPRSIVLYNGDRASTPWPGYLGERRLLAPIPLAAWGHNDVGTESAGDWNDWRDRRVIAAAGVARPERFFAMLRAQGLVVTPLPLADHFDFHELPWPPGGEADVIVTEKDAVKLDPLAPRNHRVWVAALDFTPDDAFASALLELIEPEPASTHGTRHGTPPL